MCLILTAKIEIEGNTWPLLLFSKSQKATERDPGGQLLAIRAIHLLMCFKGKDTGHSERPLEKDSIGAQSHVFSQGLIITNLHH